MSLCNFHGIRAMEETTNTLSASSLSIFQCVTLKLSSTNHYQKRFGHKENELDLIVAYVFFLA